MRTAAAIVLAPWLVLALALALALTRERAASASEARRAVIDANAALSREPALREAARAALETATAANDDPEAVAEAYFLLGQIDEGDEAFARAAGDDRATMAAAPDSTWAWKASERLAWLTARSEGDFAPLARLERVRRDPAVAGDPSAIEALEREANSFPAGMVRVEARMLVVEAWLGRLRRPDAAIVELRKVTGDPATDPLTARFAEHAIVETLIAEGHLDEASAEARANAGQLDPRYVAWTRRLVRRRTLRNAAVAEIAVFAAFAASALVRARRRKRVGDAARALGGFTPVALAFGAYVAGVGGFLASQYESGNVAPFLLLGMGAPPFVLLARAWAAVGSTRAPARLGRALLCGASVIAAAFVLLYAVNPAYLEGFGL